MKIFIPHYTPLKERKMCVTKQLQNAGIDEFEFIESYDREQLTSTDIKKYSQLNMAEISLFLKNGEIFRQEIDDIVVVIEDDAIMVSGFKERLDECLRQLSVREWDIAFTGGCCNLHAPNMQPNQLLYESNGSRGTCMYIMNRGVCKKINQIMKNETHITKPIDHWFNYIYTKYPLKYYWSEPILVCQGSEVGLFKSAIR